MPDCMQATVLVPITLSGRWIGTLGNLAAARCSAWFDRLIPGAMVALGVDDVEIGRRAEIDDDKGRLVAVVGADGVAQPVGADLIRPVDDGAGAKLDADLADHQRLAAAIMAAKPPQVEIGLGYDAGDDGASELLSHQVFQRQHMVEPHYIFVGSAPGVGGGSPSALEPIALPHGKHRVGVIGVDCEEHRASSASDREDFASGDAPEFSRAFQQERAVLIYVDEPAVQGGGLQSDPDRLTERGGARTPSLAYRREALFVPAPHPGLEMAGELLERERR